MQEVSGYYQGVQGGVHLCSPRIIVQLTVLNLSDILSDSFHIEEPDLNCTFNIGRFEWEIRILEYFGSGNPAAEKHPCNDQVAAANAEAPPAPTAEVSENMSSLRKEVDGSPPVTSWKLWTKLWGYYVRYVPKSPLTSVLCFESKKALEEVSRSYSRLVVMSGYASHPTMVWIGDAGARHAMFDQLPLFARCSLEAQSHPVTQRVSQFMYRCRYIQ